MSKALQIGCPYHKARPGAPCYPGAGTNACIDRQREAAELTRISDELRRVPTAQRGVK